MRSVVITVALVCLVIFANGSPEAQGNASDDFTILKSYNTEAHLLALWRMGSSADAGYAEFDGVLELVSTLDSEDWRVRWLAVEAYAKLCPLLVASGGANPRGYGTYAEAGYGRLENMVGYDEEDAIREVCIRALTSRPTGKSNRLPSWLKRALGDELPTVDTLATDYLARFLETNPDSAYSAIIAYKDAYAWTNPDSIDFLKRELREGNEDVAAGLKALERQKLRLGRQGKNIGEAFGMVGGSAMPGLIEIYETKPYLRKEIIHIWSWIGSEAAGVGDLLAAEIANPESPYSMHALGAIRTTKPVGNLDVADALLPYVLREKPGTSAMLALKALGPLPEEYVDAIIAQIEAGTEIRHNDLIQALGVTGSESQRAMDYLDALALDESKPYTQRDAAVRALAIMALEGNADAAQTAIDATENNSAHRQRLVGQLTYQGAALEQPEVIRVLADSLGTAELLLKMPGLANLPEFEAEVQAAIVAKLEDPRTKARQVISLAPLLADDTPLPDGLGLRIDGCLNTASSIGDGFFLFFATNYPELALEQYHKYTALDVQGKRHIPRMILQHLGENAAPLLVDLAAQMDSALGSETASDWIAGRKSTKTFGGINPVRWGGPTPDLSYEFASAVEQAGPEAAAYSTYMLFLLKQAYFERTQLTIPISDIDDPYKRERHIEREYSRSDYVIEKLIGALIAIGPDSIPSVRAASAGSLNNGPVSVITVAQYSDAEYDERLRIATLRILGELGKGDEQIAAMLARTLNVPTDYTLGFTSMSPSDLNDQRQIVAAEALGKVGVVTDEIVTELLECANSDNPNVRRAVINALRSLAGWE